MNHLVYLKDEGVNAVSPNSPAVLPPSKPTFFSRNPDLWPVFREPGFATLNEFRARGLAPDARLNAWPDGRARLADLCETMPVPATMRTPGSPWRSCCLPAPCQGLGEPLQRRERHHHVGGSRHLWRPDGHSGQSQPGLLRIRRGGRGAGKEGGAPDSAAGGLRPGPRHRHLHPGGTFCNLYGYLLGIRKSLPQAKHKGLGHYQDYRIINSQGGHYSNITNLSLLGVDIENKTIRIQVGRTTTSISDHLERTLTACFALKHVVPTIMLTMGTTDTFGVDGVKPVVDLRDRLCERFEVAVKPTSTSTPPSAGR